VKDGLMALGRLVAGQAVAVGGHRGRLSVATRFEVIGIAGLEAGGVVLRERLLRLSAADLVPRLPGQPLVPQRDAALVDAVDRGFREVAHGVLPECPAARVDGAEGKRKEEEYRPHGGSVPERVRRPTGGRPTPSYFDWQALPTLRDVPILPPHAGE